MRELNKRLPAIINQEDEDEAGEELSPEGSEEEDLVEGDGDDSSEEQ